MSEEKNSTQRAMEIVLALASENIIFISEHYREEVLEAIERVELVAGQLARESKIRHDRTKRVRHSYERNHLSLMNDEVFAACNRAGSAGTRSYFSSRGWFSIGSNLSERGFSAIEIEFILRSEWMDAVIRAVEKDWGTYSSDDFERTLGERTASPKKFRAEASFEMLDQLEELDTELSQEEKDELASEARIERQLDDL